MSGTQETNNIRASPLKTHKGSNLIKKPAVLPAISPTTLSSVSFASQRQPVIIYTHSPKIIHIEACDFMAVVQKLTGFSASSSADNHHNSILPSPNNDDTPISTKRRKISIGKKEESIESSMHATLQLVPQQWSSIARTTANFEFNPLHSDASSFMQGYVSEFCDWSNSSYKCTEL